MKNDFEKIVATLTEHKIKTKVWQKKNIKERCKC